MKRLVLTALAATLAATGANAADILPVVVAPAPAPVMIPPPAAPTMYMSVFGGAVLSRNVVWEQPDPEASINSFGWRIGGAIGKYFSPNSAGELEVTFARAQAFLVCDLENQPILCTDPANIPGAGNGAPGFATSSLLTIMANLRVGPSTGQFRPYFAIGAGAARLSLVSNLGADGVGPGGGDNVDWTWGAQAMVGLDFAMSDTVLFGVRYRFQRIGRTNFVDLGTDPFTIAPFNVHSIEGGITLLFGN